MKVLAQDNLYHFTKAKTAINNILPNSTIQINNFRAVNDPKEAHEWPFYFYDNTFSNSSEAISLDHFNALDDYMKSHSLIACFKHEYGCKVNEFHDDHENSRAFYDMRMWDQYADKHKGVCLVFDRKALLECLINDDSHIFFHGPIEYGKLFNNPEDPFAIDFHNFHEEGDSYLFSKLNKNVSDYLFSKTYPWKAESEYRIAALCKKHEEKIYLNFSNALKAVILGLDISNEDAKEICSVLNGKTQVFKIDSRYWKTTVFEVETSDPEHAYVLDGVHFSTNIPCHYVQTRVRNALGQPCMLRIDSESGNVMLVDK